MQVRSLFFDKKIFSDRESHASERGSKHLQNSCVWTIFSFGFSRLAKERDHDTKRKLILIFPEKFTLLLYISFLTSRSFSCFFFAKKERNGHFLIYLVFLLVSHVNICPPLFFLILWFSRQKKKKTTKKQKKTNLFLGIWTVVYLLLFLVGVVSKHWKGLHQYSHTHSSGVSWIYYEVYYLLLTTTLSIAERSQSWPEPFIPPPLKKKMYIFIYLKRRDSLGFIFLKKKRGRPD